MPPTPPPADHLPADASNNEAVDSGRRKSNPPQAVPSRDESIPVHQVEQHLELLESRFSDLQKQAQHLQRLSALGTMSAMLAHEVRNMMTPVVSYAQYALASNDPQLTIKALEVAMKNAKNTADLCEGIMQMAGDDDDSVSCELEKVVTEAVNCLGRGLERDAITLVIEIPQGQTARINATALRQVLFNLIINARQAMLERGGTLTIKAESTPEVVHLTVSDTGSGIRSDDLPHVFEPFFSTKRNEGQPDKRGNGLGLTICRQLVATSGGELSVKSKWGIGTTFTLSIPVT